MKFSQFLTINAVTAFILLSACHKNGASAKDCDQFWIDKMNKEWGTKPDCKDKSLYATLSKGTYNGTVIYFTGVDGPGIVSASVAPLEYVVTCKGDSIKIDDPKKIQNPVLLIRSCQ